MNKVKIQGLEISACHGVHAEEKVNPQPFVFDIEVYCDFEKNWQSDDLGNTVNYSAVCDLVARTVWENTFNLIETLAYTCAYCILDNFAAQGVDITVYKPQAPVKHKFDRVGVSISVKRTVAYLSLGSSMGDRKAYLDRAVELLSKSSGIKVTKVSSYIQTQPVGGVAKNTFLNCAAEIQTYLSPHALLDQIHRIESECDRVRKERWGDRTLDIDIIFYGKQQVREDDLIIPHPEYLNREFVIEPLKEICPEFLCPSCLKKIKNL